MQVNDNAERDLKETYLENLKTDSEKELKDEATDYVTKYYALRGPDLDTVINGQVPRLTWQQALSEAGRSLKDESIFFGRSIATPIRDNGHFLVFKLAQGKESARDLIREAQWMEYLCAHRHLFPLRFNIPEVIKFRCPN